MSRVVIVGSGQGGVQTAFSLRDEGFDGEIAIVGEEADAPYQRPPLSKAYLLGKIDDEGVLLKGRALYGDYRLRLIAGTRATALDRAGLTLELATGERLPYDHLVLATGARPRRLGVAGEDLEGVTPIRTLADARRVMALLPKARRAVVVGAGFIGLEFAAVARTLGVEVTVVELAARAMGRALSGETTRFFEARHAAWGVTFAFGAGVSGFEGRDGRLIGVTLSDGRRLDADIAIVGVGVVPNAELAQAAGLAVGDGVRVDAMLLTEDAAISAVGDCADHPNRFAPGDTVRVESVQNATDQARCVAARLAGRPAPYQAVPWFWSDQGDLKLQIAGIGTGHDTTVVRGDFQRGAFSVFCWRGGALAAVESVNRGPDHVMARRLIAAGAAITPEQAADESVPLKAYL